MIIKTIRQKPKSMVYEFTDLPPRINKLTLQITKQSFHLIINVHHYELSPIYQPIAYPNHLNELTLKQFQSQLNRVIPYLIPHRLYHVHFFLYGA